MKVFCYSPSDDAIWVDAAQQNQRQQLAFEDKVSLKSIWTPIQLSSLAKNQKTKKKLIKMDFLAVTTFPSMIVSETAMKHLVNSYGKFLECLPVYVDDDKYYAVNVTCIVDALEISKAGILPEENEINALEPCLIRAAFKEDSIRGLPLFRLKTKNIHETYLSEDFVNEIGRSGLTGFGARLEWDSEVHKNGFDMFGNPLE